MKATTQRRSHLPYGYVTYTGNEMRDHVVDTYNRLQDEINAWVDAGRPVPEHLLDESFSVMQYAALYA